MDDTNTNHYKRNKKLWTNKAFTLVELIIVITILAILATIAFMSFQGYNKNARDWNRATSLKTIETGLDLYSIQTWVYPEPEWTISTGSINTIDGEQILVKKWVIWDNTSRVVRLNTTPKDPLSLTNYVYATTNDNREYQIGTVLETWVSYFPLIKNTYADNWYQAKVLGNYKWYITFNSWGLIYITNIPSLLWSWDISVNLLGSEPKYIINNGKNLPYHPSKWYISSDELGTENPIQVIQEKTQNTNATLISISKTELEQIVKELNQDENYELPQDLKNSLNVDSAQDIIKSFWVNNTQDFERVILGNKNTTSGKVIPKTPWICWEAATAYAHNMTNFTGWVNNFCEVGVLEGSEPIFPTQWNNVSWICVSPDWGESAECSASRANPDEEVKACSGKPLNSKYFNGTDDYSVTVPFWTQAPAVTYSVTPTENSCEYSCINGYSMNAWRCNDLTPPTWWSFNINEWATNTNVTDITLNITCAIDQIDGSDIQVAFGNTATPTNWQNCTGSKSLVHTITTWDGVKTVYVRFRDSAGNMTTAISQTITYEGALYYFTTHTFTNCWMTGRTWPTLAACRSSYATSWVGNDNFFKEAHAQWIQLWTVPKTGWYSIDTYWAQGGTFHFTWWRWVRMKWDFYLVKWEKLKILVWQNGGNSGDPHWNETWWWGGTFVTNASNTALIVAGGWGGAPSNTYGVSCSRDISSQWDATTSTSGRTITCNTTASGWASGNWWVSNWSHQWWAWWGLTGNWQNWIAHCSQPQWWASFTNWWVGGLWNSCYVTANFWWFWWWWWGGLWWPWAWWGYSWWGVAWSWSSYSTYGGWGGSFRAATYNWNSVTNPLATEWARSGHWQVIITALN